jgi:hypothetical protein
MSRTDVTPPERVPQALLDGRPAIAVARIGREVDVGSMRPGW